MKRPRINPWGKMAAKNKNKSDGDENTAVNLGLNSDMFIFTDLSDSEVVDSIEIRFTGLPEGAVINGATYSEETAAYLVAGPKDMENISVTLPEKWNNIFNAALNLESDAGSYSEQISFKVKTINGARTIVVLSSVINEGASEPPDEIDKSDILESDKRVKEEKSDLSKTDQNVDADPSDLGPENLHPNQSALDDEKPEVEIDSPTLNLKYSYEENGDHDSKKLVNDKAEYGLANDISMKSNPSELGDDYKHPIGSKFRSLRFARGTHSIIFFLFAVLGCTVLITAKVFTPSPYVYISLVIVIMVTYFIINLMDWVGLNLRYDQLGDNLYYLGFVYTLGSLAHTLLIFGGNQLDINDVISSFGIALWSTLTGVILRIVAHQMHVDPTEVEDAIRADLSDMTARLRASLDNVVRDMSVFGEETKQVIVELHTDMSSNFNENVNSMVKSSESVVMGVGSAFELFSENTQRLNEVSRQTVASMEKLFHKIDSIQAPENIIADKLKPIDTQINQIVSALDNFSTKIEEVKIPQDLVEKKLDPAFQGISLIVTEIETLQKRQSGQVEQLAEKLNSVGDVFSGLVRKMAELGEELGEVDIAHHAKSAGSELTLLSKEMVNLTDRIKTSSETDLDSLKNLRVKIAASLEQAQNGNVELEEELKKSRALNLETHTSLVDMTRTIKDSIS
jgi:hypothetical protein